jgi:hypothetical protein
MNPLGSMARSRPLSKSPWILEISGLAAARWLPAPWLAQPEQRWNIYANPTVPTRLAVAVGTGDSELVVGGMRLTNLRLETGSGDVTLDLSGDWQTNLNATLDVGVGDITILAPKGVGVRVVADQSVGDVESRDFSFRDGAYVNQAYGRTAYQLEIEVVQGAGDIEISVQ